MALAKNEEIYIDKIARGRAMAKALDEAWKHLKLGSWVTIRECPATGSNGRTLSGRVIFKNEHYFTIQAKRYRESFMWVDVVTGKIRQLKYGELLIKVQDGLPVMIERATEKVKL